jgi:FixJ family two-component response regulator
MNEIRTQTQSLSQAHARLPVPTVFVVDDDVSVRESLEPLILSLGFEVTAFSTAEEFLLHPSPVAPSCLILDMKLPGLGGLEVQGRIGGRQAFPIIFITGYADIPTAVRAMKSGAFEVLTKPLQEESLVSAIKEAIARSTRALAIEVTERALRNCYAGLTRREQQVMKLVVQGLLNKQIGGELGISEITVKAHRGSLMRKMRARSLADLVTMADRLSLRAS